MMTKENAREAVGRVVRWVTLELTRRTTTEMHTRMVWAFLPVRPLWQDVRITAEQEMRKEFKEM